MKGSIVYFIVDSAFPAKMSTLEGQGPCQSESPRKLQELTALKTLDIYGKVSLGMR